jgi:hypothetical protein
MFRCFYENARVNKDNALIACEVNLQPSFFVTLYWSVNCVNQTDKIMITLKFSVYLHYLNLILDAISFSKMSLAI